MMLKFSILIVTALLLAECCMANPAQQHGKLVSRQKRLSPVAFYDYGDYGSSYGRPYQPGGGQSGMNLNQQMMPVLLMGMGKRR